MDSEKIVCGLVLRIEFIPQHLLAVSSISRFLRSLSLFLPYFLHLEL